MSSGASVTIEAVSRYGSERWRGVVTQDMFANSRDVFVRLESNHGPKRALGFLARRHEGWVEAAIVNCLSDCPIGYQEVQFAATLDNPTGEPKDRNRLLWSTAPLFSEGVWVGLADQTGYAFVWGVPGWDKDRSADRVNRVFTPGPWPLHEGPTDHAYRWWGTPDPRGEDHIPDTHRTGSPRNRWATWYEAAWRYDPDSSEWFGAPRVLMRYVCEQWGTSYEGEEREEVFHAGRPYHLLSPQGQVFLRGSAWGEDQWATNEGALRIRKGDRWPVGEGLETFGRDSLPLWNPRENEGGWDRSRWVGKRIQGGIWSPGQITSDGSVNGWDREHMHVEELAFAVHALDSRLAQISLANLVEGLVGADWEYKQYGANVLVIPGSDHSSRTFGLCLRALIRYAQVCPPPRAAGIWWAARQMRDVALRRFENGLMPAWAKGRPVMLSRNRQASNREGTRWIEEACWQAATIADTAFMAADLDNAGEKDLWIDLGMNAIEPAIACYVEGQGLRENVIAKGDETLFSGEAQWLSTRHWCLDPLAKASACDRPHEFAGQIAREGWEHLRSRQGYPTFGRDSEHAWKWHRTCAALWGWE